MNDNFASHPVDLDAVQDDTGALPWDTFATVAAVAVRQAKQRGTSLGLLIAALDEPPAIVAGTGMGPEAAAVDVISGIILQNVDPTTVLGRHGPRSFIVLLQGSQPADAWRTAEQIHAEIRRYVEEMDVPAPFTATLGISTLPQAGATVAELVRSAEDAVVEGIAHGGDVVRLYRASAMIDDPEDGHAAAPSLSPAPSLDRDQLAAQRSEVLAQAIRDYERAEIEGLAIRTAGDPCPACSEVAQALYVPQWSPILPLAGCTAIEGCRCLYALPPIDPHRRPPPAPAIGYEKIEIPRTLRNAALFGPDPRGSAPAENVALYLDNYPLLPFNAGLELHSGEVTYLTRSARFGWEESRSDAETVHGLPFPIRQEFRAWVRQLGKPPAIPSSALRQRGEGVVHLTNWRLFFGKAGALDTLLLADVTELEYYRDGLALTAAGRYNRLLILVRDPLQVGLCIARALRDIARSWS